MNTFAELQGSSSSDTEADRSTASEATTPEKLESVGSQGNVTMKEKDKDSKEGDEASVDAGRKETSQDVKPEKVDGGGEREGKVFTIHLVLPGVPQPVDVVVSYVFSCPVTLK